MWGVKEKKQTGKTRHLGRVTAPFMLIYYPANPPPNYFNSWIQTCVNTQIRELSPHSNPSLLDCFILPRRGAEKGVCGNRSSRQPAFTAGLHKGNAKPVLIWLQCEDDTGKPALLWTRCKYLDRPPIATIILLYLGGWARSSIIHVNVEQVIFEQVTQCLSKSV